MNTVKKVIDFIPQIFSGSTLSHTDALTLTQNKTDVWEILYGANLIRQHYKGTYIKLCSIINAKSGNCSENCKFCAQSVHHNSKIITYPLVTKETFGTAWQNAQAAKAHEFGIVTSGNELSQEEISLLSNVIKELDTHQTPSLCASLGKSSPEVLNQLRRAGLRKYHHNLETSRRFFPKICSTHSYDERIQTIKNVQHAGLKICSGGIFGMGETWEDRIDLAFTLKELGVNSIPLNFLIPVQGTSLETLSPLTPLEILRIIALFRYVLPDKDIRVCAGREKNLRDFQSWIFYAGANGMMVGGYLTQAGRSIQEDLNMIKDMGLQLETPVCPDKPASAIETSKHTGNPSVLT